MGVVQSARQALGVAGGGRWEEGGAALPSLILLLLEQVPLKKGFWGFLNCYSECFEKRIATGDLGSLEMTLPPRACFLSVFPISGPEVLGQ